MPLRQALIEVGGVRPILMTTLALIAGMIPVALGPGEGADFRAPLAQEGTRCSGLPDLAAQGYFLRIFA